MNALLSVVALMLTMCFLEAGELRYFLLASSEKREFVELSTDKSFVTITDGDHKKKKEISVEVGRRIFGKFYAIPDLASFLKTDGSSISTKENHVIMLTDQRKSRRAVGAIYVFNRKKNKNNTHFQEFLSLVKE